MSDSSLPAPRPLRNYGAWAFYWLPLLAWVAFAFALSTTIGGYEESIRLLYAVLVFFMPETITPPLHTIYGSIHLLRRGATVFVYAGIILLLIRALQAGATRLTRRTLAVGGGASLLIAGADNAVRFFSPRRHPGWDDFAWEAATMLLVVAATALFFAAKQWERDLAPAPP
ncbi:MAG: hypothetical protein H7Y38_13155 [Armatimonadetes bacterium]|nr:hypothetical protein [Armatimonadota bacterium]